MPLVDVFEMVLGYCLCCSAKLIIKNDKSHKTNDKSNIHFNDTANDSNDYEYYQCPNKTCFMRNRNKIEQVILTLIAIFIV